MYKKHLLFILHSIIFSGLISAQDTIYNSMTLNLGVGNIMRQDQTFSSLIHKKWSPVNLSFSFNRSKKVEQMAILRYALYKPQVGESFSYYSAFNINTNSTYPHSFNMLDLQYGLGKKVLKRDDFDIVLGIKSKNRIWISSYNYAESGISGYYLVFGLDLWLKFDYVINQKNKLSANVGVPIIAFIYRNPYLGQDDWYFEDNISHKGLKTLGQHIKRGKLQSWETSQSFDLDLVYKHSLSHKYGIGLGYWFSWNFNNYPTKMSSIENVINLSSTYKF